MKLTPQDIDGLVKWSLIRAARQAEREFTELFAAHGLSPVQFGVLCHLSTGAAFTHAQFDAALSCALTDKASVALKGAFSTLLDGDLRDDVDADRDIFFGGVNASYSF